MSYYRKRVKAFGYALSGIRAFLKEPHARIHLLASIVVVSMAWWLQVGLLKWCILLCCIALVFLAEMLNSAIESLTDRISTEFHPLAGKAKDMAAGAVLLVAMFVAIIGLLIFIPELIRFLP